MRTHVRLTEPSVSDHRVTHDRKGREGKGIGRECWDAVPIHRHLGDAVAAHRRPEPTAPRRWMAADAASIGGRP